MRSISRRGFVKAALSATAMSVPLLDGPLARGGETDPLPFTGVNIAGGEFFEPETKLNPVYGRDFIYPTPEQFAYFASIGMNIIRLPFRWETVQRNPRQPLDEAELARLRRTVAAARAAGHVVILDPHNYARHRGRVVGSKDLPEDSLADFWGRMATAFRGDSRIWFGLMNEPHSMPTEQWVKAANGAIAAIRKTGADNLILVPGNGWSNASGWHENWYGTPNASAMLKIVDPSRKFLVETHLYFDGNGSGTSAEVVSATIGTERLEGFTRWCRQNGLRAFLGEFAVAADESGRIAATNTLRAMERDWDVWAGFTWWAAGAWWKDYMFSLEPRNGRASGQLAFLRPHLQQPVLSTGSGAPI